MQTYRKNSQVISNLLDNAIRYAGSGETVRVSMAKKIRKCGNKKDHEQFESIIDITDSGPGIDPQLLENDRLFSKFNSNNPVSSTE